MNLSLNCKINYLADKKDNKYLPWQFYKLQNLISIPLIGKRPFIKQWNQAKKTVPASYINQNIGILCGKTNNITVLDLDGIPAVSFFKQLCEQNGFKDIKTPTVITPNGGLHLYFKYCNDLKSSLGLKIEDTKLAWDLKNNGLVVAPPSSLFKDDKMIKYKWVKNKSLNHIEFKEIPNWLKIFIKQHQS